MTTAYRVILFGAVLTMGIAEAWTGQPLWHAAFFMIVGAAGLTLSLRRLPAR